MSLCGHHFVTVSLKTAQKVSPKFFGKERLCVSVCVCIYMYVVWNGMTVYCFYRFLTGVNSVLLMLTWNLFT